MTCVFLLYLCPKSEVFSSSPLQNTIKQGKQILSEKSFGTTGIQERIMEVKDVWKRLEDQAAQHLNHLQEALNFFQFSTETDDLAAWLQDAYRLVSSEDFGHDEYSTQSLLKKHKGVTEAIDKHRLHVVALRKHMMVLPLQYQEQEVCYSLSLNISTMSYSSFLKIS